MSVDYHIRKANVEDVPLIAHQRLQMFKDMGFEDDAALDAMDRSFRVWVAEKLRVGLYRGWFAVADDQVIAGVGLWLNEWIPHPYDPRPLRGYILNVFTERNYRKQGIARHLVEEILAYCRAEDIHMVALHASDEGRPIYESLGFAASNELRVHL